MDESRRTKSRRLRQGVLVSVLLALVILCGALLTEWAERSGLTSVRHHYALLLFTYGGPLLAVILGYDRVEGALARRGRPRDPR